MNLVRSTGTLSEKDIVQTLYLIPEPLLDDFLSTFQRSFPPSERRKLTGNKRVRIRFGTALTTLGDINMDGFYGETLPKIGLRVSLIQQEGNKNLLKDLPLTKMLQFLQI